MRQHTKEFKNEIQKNGRQLDSKIIIKGSELVLGAEDLFSVTPVTNSTLLKSVMKEVDFESKQKISVGQEINVQSGVKVGNEFEYLIFGNYVVYKNEYNAETESYSHICYDKMLNTMIDYTPLDVTYPINLREYINAIATKCGLKFANKDDTFPNYDTEINEDHFSNGNYTFRDVLDYVNQLVGGWFCINDNDELEIRYPELARNYGEVSGESLNFISDVSDEISKLTIDGKSTQATSTDPVSPSPDNPSEVKCIKGINLLKGLSTPRTDTDYWNSLSSVFTPLSDGWGKWEYDNTSGTSTSFMNAMVNLSAIDLKPSTTYTFVVEIRNSTISESSGAYLQVITANATGAFKTGRLISYQDINENKTIVFNSVTKDSFNGVTRGVDTFLRLGAGTKGTVEARISLFEYNNAPETSNYIYIPYGNIQISIAQNNIKKALNINLQENEVCSLPNGVKDELVIENGKAKIIKKIGKVVFNGSENWQLYEKAGPQPRRFGLRDTNVPNDLSMISNYFACKSKLEGYQTDLSLWTQLYYYAITDINSYWADATELKTWLSTHNTIVYYELVTPTEIDLGEVGNLSTFKGINNVSLIATLSTNMSITYITNFEELDKHYLKDVNVSFTKKYGAINSVVFSRGGGSDNIYRRDITSITKNGLTEIKIADNPFLEGNDRENFIQPLFDKLNGLEFYIMDIASTGIMYLELGDLYYFNMVEEKPSLKSGLVKSGMRKAQGSSGGKHLCLLMNDEINITQGLEENIYTDEPEITETDYKTASITDTSIKNAIIQTNKNSAEILLKVNSDEVVSAINLSPESIKISSAKLDIDAIATFTNSKLAEAGSTVINGANITTGSISCDRLNGGTINGQTIRGGSISIQTGNYYFDMGTSTSNPNCSGLNVGGYGIKAYSNITATGFAITDSDTGKSQSINIYDGHGRVWYLTFTGGILTASEYK